MILPFSISITTCRMGDRALLSLPMQNTDLTLPLATLLRPETLDDFIGQRHLLGPGKPLRLAITEGRCHSMVLWGPPGTGKTTLAHMMANAGHHAFESLSAVFSGVKDIREAVTRAKERLPSQRTILFVDEVHRFNKSQQDAFLPFIEDGTLLFIGATTENPSFALNNALLSRTRVYVLHALDHTDLIPIIQKALTITGLSLADDLCEQLSKAADGDARRCLNFLELMQQISASQQSTTITEDHFHAAISGGLTRRFDNKGDDFYDQISALHKSVRGSDPDAALYWFCRMIDGGCDPLYLARRMIRMATEDIGNADPRALSMALHAWETYERLGSPEGELALAQVIIFLSVCAKSNASYTAYNAALQFAKEHGSLPVPDHLRNAPTQLMKNLGYGKEYRYAHNEPDAYAAEEKYFPDSLEPTRFYQPTDRGLELKIREKLQQLRDRKKPRHT